MQCGFCVLQSAQLKNETLNYEEKEQTLVNDAVKHLCKLRNREQDSEALCSLDSVLKLETEKRPGVRMSSFIRSFIHSLIRSFVHSFVIASFISVVLSPHSGDQRTDPVSARRASQQVGGESASAGGDHDAHVALHRARVTPQEDDDRERRAAEPPDGGAGRAATTHHRGASDMHTRTHTRTHTHTHTHTLMANTVMISAV